MQYSTTSFKFVCLAIVFATFTSAAPIQAAPAPPKPSAKSAPPKANPPSSASKVAGAAYVITNDPSGNRIVAMNIDSNGFLSTVTTTDAGGRGAHGITDPIGPDPLFSQGAIKVNKANNMLVTINAASNTATMFNIDPNNPSKLTMVGTPVSSGGEFPMSLAINKKGTMVCVLNSGVVNGVNCYKTDKTLGLIEIPNTLRSLGLNQTTPATGPAGTASHVIFNADESQLIASVKGVPPTPGFLATWSISSTDGSLSPEPVKSTPAAGGLLPFGMSLIPNSNAVLVTDAGVGFDIFDFGGATKSANNGNATAKGSAAPSKAHAKRSQQAASASVTSLPSSKSNNDSASSSSSSQSKSTSSSSDSNSASSSSQASSTIVPIAGQGAVCWATFSAKSGNFYLSDITTALITEVNVDKNLKGTVVKQYQQSKGSGPIDSEVATVGANDFLYVLAANATTIDVLSVNQPGNAKPVQRFNFGSALQGSGIKFSNVNLQGMATFIKG